ncbi:hypothetical protein LUW76_31015 [Actinomadura madurae]|uniref:hypothetical protein n=1 Tax=Actinomadura madurae TaxID=1993 RepID=UPI002026EEA0|nr:hypothetical protein [Actinomadura madurae]URM98423.1 hypothetical protein LUW76_31015 [Actinomadura madurae]
MTDDDGTIVDAAELLATALRHLDDHDTRRPISEIPTLDEAASRPFRPFPALAIAMASHVLSAWEVRTFQVERGDHGDRIRYFTAVGHDSLRPFRACTVFVPDLGTQRVVEMCGHAFCSNIAPAGPGSRCPDHLLDPASNGPFHWLRLAGEAAISAERQRGARPETENLTVAAIRRGLPLPEICRAVSADIWTVQALADEPVPLPDDINDSDNPDNWPFVLTPDQDITATDTRRIYAFDDRGYVPADLAPETVLARRGEFYTYFHAYEGGPLIVCGEHRRLFRLEWWQVQDHLPQHRLARRAEERRQQMYEPPDSWEDYV